MKKIESLRGNLAFNISGAIVLVLMLFGVLVSFLGFANFTEAFKREYEVTTYHMADTAATLVNGDHLDDYLAGGETEEYQLSKQHLDLYCKRMDIARAIGRYKKENNLPVLDSERERNLLNKVADLAGEENEQGIRALYHLLLDHSRLRQQLDGRPQSALGTQIREAVAAMPAFFPE